MSNHFTGLSLGPPLGDQRLDHCDLYAFQSPTDPARTVIILNGNPRADALHPDAIYRLNIDNDSDCLTDIAFSYVFSKPEGEKQTVSVFVAEARKPAQPKSSERRSSPTPKPPSAATRISSDPGPSRSSPERAATPSFLTSTGSRTSSTRRAAEISPLRTSEANRLGPASTRIRRPMCSRRRSRCRRASSAPIRQFASGADAACGRTAN